MQTYYNTNSEVGLELRTSKEKSFLQQNRILSYFQTFPQDTFTPEEVWQAVFDPYVPLTSVRRAITNLTEVGKLVKTDVFKVSSFGKRCHCWKAAAPVFAKELL